MAEQSISLARGLWRGENAKAALTFFFPSVLHFYQEAGLSLIKVARMGGIGVRRHCSKAGEGILFQYCGWHLNRCWCEWWEGKVKVNNGGKSAQGSVLLIQCWIYFLFTGDYVLQRGMGVTSVKEKFCFITTFVVLGIIPYSNNPSKCIKAMCWGLGTWQQCCNKSQRGKKHKQPDD